MEKLKAGIYSCLFWNSERLGKYSTSPNVSLCYYLVGELNVERLSLSLKDAVEATPLLNWHLEEFDGTLYWCKNESLVELEVLEGRRKDDVEFTQLNIKKGPLYRFVLVKLGNGTFHLSMLFHHVVFEARSIPRFVSRLSDAYNGRPLSPIIPPSIIADAFDAQWLRLEMLEKSGADAFWKKALSTAPQQNVLPFDTSQVTETEKDLQAGVIFEVDKKLWKERNRQLRRYSLFNVLMATWGALVARYCDQQYVQILYPVAIGSQREDVFGSAINSLVQVYRLGKHTCLLNLCEDYAQMVRQMKTDTGVKYSEWPTERVLRASPIECVNVGFAMVASREPIMLNEIVVTPAAYREQDMGEGELWLLCDEHAERLRFQLLYRPSCLSEMQARQMKEHFVALLGWSMKQPDSAFSDFPLVTPEQAVTCGVRREWGVATLLSGFEHQVQLRPKHLAVRLGDSAVSYQDLDIHAHRLALALRENYFREYGHLMPADTLIGLCVQDRLSLLPGILAILKAGAAYVPIDPSYPLERQQVMLNDSSPALMLSDVIYETPQAMPTVNIAAQPLQPDAVLPQVQPEHLAYVIYTSGSTGKPKGVMVSHGAAVNAVQAKVENDGLDEAAVACLMLSYAFDAAVAVIFSALHAGSTLSLPMQTPLSDREMHGLGVTHLTCPAALASWLAGAKLPSLRQLNLGGDAIAGSVLSRLVAGYPAVTLEYGITEAGIISTMEKKADANVPQSIGHALPNTQLYVLDRFGQFLPDGATGELYLGGQGLARGYLNDPESTDQNFVPNPFVTGQECGGGNSRLYRTGDLVRRRLDGRIEFLGRADNQIKLRGYRIERQEIIQGMHDLPGVLQAYACLQRLAPGERLIGYFTAAETLDTKALLAALASLLPAYALPHQLVQVPAFPLTANGKLDPMAFPVPLLDVDNIVPPRDEVEMTLMAIWQNLFPGVLFGIDTQFHDLGGNSVQAMRMTQAIEKKLGRALPLENVLRFPSIARLAEVIRMGGERIVEHSSGNLITFRAGDAGNIICIHPAGGTAFCYSTLAQACNSALGVYGIQAQGVRPGESLLPDVQAMARHYLTQIRHLTDTPHVFAGWSLGGYIALEMAYLLRTEGNVHTQLVLFDTQSPDFNVNAVQETTREDFVEKLVRFNGIHSGVREEDIQRFHQLYNHNVLSMKRYRASCYDGPALFIRVEETALEQSEAWRHWLPQLRVVTVSGGHWTLMEPPHVQAVAEQVQDCLTDSL